MLFRMPNTQPASAVMASVRPGRMLCWKASERNDGAQLGVSPAL